MHMTKRHDRDPVWLICSLLAALGACVGIIGVAYHQTESLGRLLAGFTCLIVAWGSGVCWLRYRLGR
jgi:hypothetical protein